MQPELPHIEEQPERCLVESKSAADHNSSADDDCHENSHRLSKTDQVWFKLGVYLLDDIFLHSLAFFDLEPCLCLQQLIRPEGDLDSVRRDATCRDEIRRCKLDFNCHIVFGEINDIIREVLILVLVFRTHHELKVNCRSNLEVSVPFWCKVSFVIRLALCPS